MRWESIVQGMSKLCGFEIHRTLPGAEYMQCAPFTYSTYRPWFEPWFQEIYAKVASNTEVTPDRCYTLYKLCLHCLHLDGDLAECGVYRGGTAFLLARTISEHSGRATRLHLFDTFAGMPAAADADPSPHKKGDFGDVSLESVRAYLTSFNDVSFYPGLIPDTFQHITSQRFSMIHIDVDLYSSVRDCCEFFYPRLLAGGMMVFDDYGLPHYKDAAKKAVDEFFREKAESPVVLTTGQCFVIKL
jgi:O-methyltransferase